MDKSIRNKCTINPTDLHLMSEDVSTHYILSHYSHHISFYGLLFWTLLYVFSAVISPCSHTILITLICNVWNGLIRGQVQPITEVVTFKYELGTITCIRNNSVWELDCMALIVEIHHRNYPEKNRFVVEIKSKSNLKRQTYYCHAVCSPSLFLLCIGKTLFPPKKTRFQ